MRGERGRSTPNERVAGLVWDYWQGNLGHAADKLGCSYDQLWRVVRDQTKLSPDLALKVRRACAVTLEWLYLGVIWNSSDDRAQNMIVRFRSAYPENTWRSR